MILDTASGLQVVTQPSYKKIIVAFYASTRRGSEYRSGAEFIQFAAELGFDLAIIADLDENDEEFHFKKYAPGIKIVRIASPIRNQSSLYKYGDFYAQLIWQRRAAKWIKRHSPEAGIVWMQNGAQPWFPIHHFLEPKRQFIWGPIGGGAAPPRKLLLDMGRSAALREHLRTIIESIALKRLRKKIAAYGGDMITIFARTSEAKRRLNEMHLGLKALIVPEILAPVSATKIVRCSSRVPRFIWVGQDVPRKNLPLALDIFQWLRSAHYPEATLDVFGCNSKVAHRNVKFHGWAPKIDWQSYRDDGVLLMTSYREGLPSVIIEALSQGLLCVSSNVGALAAIKAPNLYLLPASDYPTVSQLTINDISERIARHLTGHMIDIPQIDFRHEIKEFLATKGVV